MQWTSPRECYSPVSECAEHLSPANRHKMSDVQLRQHLGATWITSVSMIILLNTLPYGSCYLSSGMDVHRCICRGRVLHVSHDTAVVWWEERKTGEGKEGAKQQREQKTANCFSGLHGQYFLEDGTRNIRTFHSPLSHRTCMHSADDANASTP